MHPSGRSPWLSFTPKPQYPHTRCIRPWHYAHDVWTRKRPPPPPPTPPLPLTPRLTAVGTGRDHATKASVRDARRYLCPRPVSGLLCQPPLCMYVHTYIHTSESDHSRVKRDWTTGNDSDRLCMPLMDADWLWMTDRLGAILRTLIDRSLLRVIWPIVISLQQNV